MSSGTLTIAISTTTSSALAVTEGATGVLLTMPAALTGTAVALYGSVDEVTWLPIYDSGVAVSLAFVASSHHVIPPRYTLGLSSIKLVSNGTEAAARSFGFVIQKVI